MDYKRLTGKSLALLCALALAAGCFSACGGTGDAKTEEGYLYGRFVEQDITPAGLTGQDASLYADGSGWIVVMAREYDGSERHYIRYTSVDAGQHWEKATLDWLEPYDVYRTIFDSGPQTGLNISIYSAVPQPGGELLGVVNRQYPDGREEYKTLRFSAAGEETDFAIDLPEAEGNDLQVTGLYYLPAGRLLYYARNIPAEGGYDPEAFAFFGIADAETGESVASFAQIRRLNYFYSSTTLFLEDLDAGEVSAWRLEDGAAVETAFTQEGLNRLREGGGSLDSGYSVFADGDNNLYAATGLGVRRLAEGDEEPELLLDAMAYSFGSPAYTLFYGTNAIALNGQEFLMLLYNSLDSSDKVVRLVYDEEALAYTGESLRVFSLYDNENVRQILAEYSRQHPEIEVVYEAGMGLGRTRGDVGGDDGGVLTEADVVKRLNTEVLTGNGPDVIFLDGLPAHSYAEKGALADLTGLLAQSGVVPEIAAVLQTDGRNYFAPACVVLPALAGSSEDLAGIAGLAEFFAALEAGPSPQRVAYREDMTEEEAREYWDSQNRALPESERPLVDFDYWPHVYAMLYHAAAPGLYVYGESVDRDNLERFCRGMRYITDAFISQDLNSEELARQLEVPLRSSNGEYPYFEMGTGSFSVNQARLCMVELSDFSWVPRVAQYREQAKTLYVQGEDGEMVAQPREGYAAPELALAAMPGFGGGVCIPKVLIGISAVSQKGALAEDFVRTVYTAEVQRFYPYRYDGGLPVVEAVLADMESAARAQPVRYSEWTGEEAVRREIPYPAEARLADVLAGVGQAYIPDPILEESLYRNVLLHCQGKLALEEAVENIVQETDTYFAEQQ